MASGATKMSSFNYFQNGKYGTIQQKDMEVSQDLHLKMSKKIAQLTKVIYALNTKNDEHEAVVQALKEQHEQHIERLYLETRNKIERYKEQLEEGLSSPAKKIEALQAHIKEHEREKEKMLREFETFKENAIRTENELKASHSQRIMELVQEVQVAKREFEVRLSMMEMLQEQLKNDKEAALCELQAKHRAELEAIKGSEAKIYEEQLRAQRAEAERLQTDLARLSSEKRQLIEEHEAKMAKAQAFYEKELNALREAQDATNEERYSLLRNQYDDLRKETERAKEEHRKREDDLLHQLAISEEENEKIKKELESLKKSLMEEESKSYLLQEQLQLAKSEVDDISAKLHEMQTYLTATRERCDQQAKELVTKSTLIGELEATKLQHESMIHNLEANVEKLKDKISWLESCKKDLESKTNELSKDQKTQLKSLQQSLEELSIEKQKLHEKYTREIKSLEEKVETEKNELAKRHTEQIEVLLQEHKTEIENMRWEAEKSLEQVKNDFETLLEQERAHHKQDKLSSQEKYEKLQTELTVKLQNAEQEVSRLRKIIEERESGLGSVTSEVKNLQDTVDKQRNELERIRAELRSSKLKLADVTSEHDKLKMLHESKMKEAQMEMKQKLEKLSIDLDNHWKETLRKECSKLRAEITAQKEEEKRQALSELTKLKEDQFSAAKQAWESKVQELLEKVSALQTQLNSHQDLTSKEVERLQQIAMEEKDRLEATIRQMSEEHSKKVSAMESDYKQRLKDMEESKNNEIQQLENEFQSKHFEELKALNLAHSTQLASLKEEHEKQLKDQLDKLRLKQAEKIELLRTELEQQHSIEMEQLTREHQQQLFAARMELERAMELIRQKEGEHAMKCSELEETISRQQTNTHHLEEEIGTLQQAVNQLTHELEAKGHEILRIRSEANTMAKAREEQLNATHKQELESLKAEHEQELQQQLTDFNTAQQLLTEKITELQTLLEEAEDRYRNREARPEDVQLIHQLQDAIREREETMNKLIEEKKYYQMELVNRETNFNKVFNASPNVGVLNPLLKKPKKKDVAQAKFSRLDPIPGSPLHETPLNSIRPLPPPPNKKFIR